MEFNHTDWSHDPRQASFSPVVIVSVVILGLTCLLGLPGNGLVLWVAGFKMRRTVNTVWFLHLTLADLLCCVSLPFNLAYVLQGRWPFGWLLCKLIPSAVILNMFASVFLLTAISIDRCLVVLKPIWCQNHRRVGTARAVCGGIWALAFLLCVPVFLYRDTFMEDQQEVCGYNYAVFDPVDHVYPVPFPDSESPDHLAVDSESLDHVFNGSTDSSRLPPIRLLPDQEEALLSPNALEEYPYLPDYVFGGLFGDEVPTELVVITLTRLVLGFALPAIIMVACYSTVVIKTRRSLFSTCPKKTFKVAVVIVIVFLVCWVPYHVVGVLFLFKEADLPDREALLTWDLFSVALASANSCFNPFLYAFLGKGFRKKACQSLRGILEAAFSEDLTPSTSASQPRASMSTGV
ncbi:C3a anaphylatoxin chemotactic receptor [Dipodomys spectabilis]|uniref:C3a anaphylatoxin chemotactic receptor n=1 Tax=Dipodomys spectabilis TaxID=105255 RepID=UPI001C53EFB8|nr:C3a anaphylatoxin chemotactic receptor [Dipodomys spectabilis]